MKINKDFFNTTVANDEFFILPMVCIDWFDGWNIHVGFLCWKGWIGIEING
jgi:hypothetical protein